MRCIDAMRSVAAALEHRGHRVTLPAPWPPGVDPGSLSESALVDRKAAFVDEHLRAIRSADALLVVNADAPQAPGYVGPSALIELAFAHAVGTPSYVMHPVGPQPCRLEVLALRPTLLDGDLDTLDGPGLRAEGAPHAVP